MKDKTRAGRRTTTYYIKIRLYKDQSRRKRKELCLPYEETKGVFVDA